MGVVIEIMRGSIAMPAVDASLGLAGYLPRALYFGIFLLVAAVCVSFVLSIAAMLLPKSAKKIALRNGRLLLFSYGILFAGNLLLCAFEAERLSADFIDLPIALTLLPGFTILVLIALADNPKKSAFNLVLLLLSALSFCAFVIPATPLLGDINSVVHQGALSAFKRVMLILLFGLILLNLLVSAVCLNAKKTHRLDILRYGAQFVCVIILLCAYNPLNFLSGQPLSAVLLVLAPLGALSISVFATELFVKKPERKAGLRKKEPDVTVVAIDDDEVPLNAS